MEIWKQRLSIPRGRKIPGFLNCFVITARAPESAAFPRSATSGLPAAYLRRLSKLRSPPAGTAFSEACSLSIASRIKASWRNFCPSHPAGKRILTGGGWRSGCSRFSLHDRPEVVGKKARRWRVANRIEVAEERRKEVSAC